MFAVNVATFILLNPTKVWDLWLCSVYVSDSEPTSAAPTSSVTETRPSLTDRTQILPNVTTTSSAAVLPSAVSLTIPQFGQRSDSAVDASLSTFDGIQVNVWRELHECFRPICLPMRYITVSFVCIFGGWKRRKANVFLVLNFASGQWWIESQFFAGFKIAVLRRAVSTLELLIIRYCLVIFKNMYPSLSVFWWTQSWKLFILRLQSQRSLFATNADLNYTKT